MSREIKILATSSRWNRRHLVEKWEICALSGEACCVHLPQTGFQWVVAHKKKKSSTTPCCRDFCAAIFRSPILEVEDTETSAPRPPCNNWAESSLAFRVATAFNFEGSTWGQLHANVMKWQHLGVRKWISNEVMSQKQSEHDKQIAFNKIDCLQIRQTYGSNGCSKTTLFVLNWKIQCKKPDRTHEPECSHFM